VVDAARVISDARRRAGLTIRDLARRAQTSHSAVSAYESGAKAPNTATLERIVEACGFNLKSELVPRGPFEDRVARGREIQRVLELAEEFPTEHRRTISGRFPAR
jgi:transcriptional regulator with XRE-family HTH domain